jgi:orotate phosphoribosyltransferase
MSRRDSLIDLLRERSVRHGDFTLASGRKSDLYVDARLTTMSPEGLSLIGPLGLSAIRDRGWRPDSAGGLTLGADPVAYALSYASVLAPPLVRAFSVRKEPKQHGTQKLIEGPFRSGDSVIVVEDVITSGTSALRAIDILRQSGAIVLGVLTVIDREEGGRETLQEAGVELISLALAGELGPVRGPLTT